MLLYKLDTLLLARGVSSSSASSEMSQTLGAPSNEPTEAGRIPEPNLSWGPAVNDRDSGARGLRVRFGDRNGDEGQADGDGEGDSVRLPIGCITVGRECARVMGGALMAGPLCERRCDRE